MQAATNNSIETSKIYQKLSERTWKEIHTISTQIDGLTKTVRKYNSYEKRNRVVRCVAVLTELINIFT